jgi:hypothetical protein
VRVGCGSVTGQGLSSDGPGLSSVGSGLSSDGVVTAPVTGRYGLVTDRGP